MKLLEINEAKEPAKGIMENTKTKMGAVPNLFKMMANNPSLLKAYTQADETFRNDSGFTSQEQEVVLLSVAIYNGCTYCVAAHSFIAMKQSNVSRDILDALRAQKDLPDAKLDALSKFATSVAKERGYPTEEATRAFKDAGYGDEHIAGVVTGVGMKTMSNYINHIGKTPVDDMFAEFKWEK
ncbi:carboxymuconolactone decarboxylase family protein [Psychroflexus sp. CAK1W]|uniref:carboxymuconolactone decarboxylase family protein n=1 Tax=Psychroflexus curvus TaxID=2873595 RepID=UPI001CCB7142|nr:carboxymuconolactone decarboxylase family protein [Psychroflexus curvus]MBZ9628653.1 carboxymuconolactone decarboxylase family protein [Psychroflexus curvus]